MSADELADLCKKLEINDSTEIENKLGIFL
jgi:hypothetical protein